ncbi:MAG: hypothetical protein KR126chlam5_01351 [Candidatus Anoxychlamydiales bacterium]|nr:hypothetical protein [Candidatus Anoxychlamydiales bacterium]
MTTSPIIALTEPILLEHILPNLKTKSLLNLSETCRFFNTLIKGDAIWKKIAKKIDFQIPDDSENLYSLVTEHIKKTPFRVGKYHYYRGAGCRPNRKIEFFRTANDPKTFQAIAKAMKCGKWYDISPNLGDKIYVEMQSPSEKVKMMIAHREKDNWHPIESELPPYIPDKKMNKLSLAMQNNAIDKLKLGTWKLSTTSDIGSSPFFENVIRINFYSED